MCLRGDDRAWGRGIWGGIRGRVEGMVLVELLPAIDKNGTRVVLGDRVIFERGKAEEHTGVVLHVDGVLLKVRWLYKRQDALPQVTGPNWAVWETVQAGDVEVLR